jgi:hypothetical protein
MAILIWLLVYFLGLLGLLGSVWLAVAPDRAVAGARWLLRILLAGGVVLSTGVGVQYSQTLATGAWCGGLPWAMAFVATAVLLWLGRESARDRDHRSTAWTRCGVSLLLLAIAIERLVNAAAGAPDLSTVLVNALDTAHAPEADAYALTDRGRRVALHQFREPDRIVAAHQVLPPETLRRVIPQDAKGSAANCHGWMFTGGCYLLKSSEVEQILCDNDYRVVTSPRPGDLIVYRNTFNQPVHTGLVKAVGVDGFVLIESKWGRLGVFLHQPFDQRYSTNFAYYRSPRDGHQLRIIELPSSPRDRSAS